MPENLKTIGAEGERVARAFLEGLGWRVLVTNYRCKAGEMDIIAEDGGGSTPALVFVEVKTRRGHGHGAPIEAVDARKGARLREIAASYLGERSAGGEEPSCRFDVVEVRPGSDGLSSVSLHSSIQTGE